MYKENEQLTERERNMYAQIHGRGHDLCMANCPFPQPNWTCTRSNDSHRIHAAISIYDHVYAIWGEDEDPDLVLDEGL